MVFNNMKDFSKYSILATDGELGTIDDFLFDDTTWTVRYLVVDTRKWLPGRSVLILPQSVKTIYPDEEQFEVDLTSEQVKNSPDINADKPVSLQHQIQIHDHYAVPYYWAATTFQPIYPLIPSPTEEGLQAPPGKEESGDPHLRSTNEVLGYHIHANDGTIGHVEDFLIEDEQWRIHYMVVDTGNWLPGRKVVVSPEWIQEVNWLEREVKVNLTKVSVRDSPKYEPSQPVTREYEEKLHEHYGFPKYWVPQPVPQV